MVLFVGFQLGHVEDFEVFFERFFFITSEHEIDAGDIMEKAGRIAKGNKSEMLNITSDQIQQSIILFKEEVE